MVIVNAKKETKAKKMKKNKRCAKCTLDCVMARMIAKEINLDIVALFGSEKPKYSPENCPKV